MRRVEYEKLESVRNLREGRLQVIASHNKSKLSEFFLGSVSNNVAHNCKQPVTVIH